MSTFPSLFTDKTSAVPANPISGSYIADSDKTLTSEVAIYSSYILSNCSLAFLCNM